MPLEKTWSAPLLWRAAQRLAGGVVRLISRLEVTGDVPDLGRDRRGWRRGPLILAANHLSPYDPIVLAAACRRVGVAPRFLATGGLFRAPVVGPLMRAAGHIRVERRTVHAARAVDDATEALAEGSIVLVYPEGRITLDPGLWPERGRTGAARLALETGAAVVPVAVWGAHEVLPYRAPAGMGPMLRRSLRHRPVVRVHFGAPVDLAGVEPGPGAAKHATEAIMDAITATLAPLRADEPDRPRFIDPSRPQETRRSRPR